RSAEDPWPPAERRTSVRNWSPLPDDTITSSGTTWPPTGATGPLAPVVTQKAAARTGAEQASSPPPARAAPRTLRPRSRPLPGPASGRGSASAAAHPASSRPTAAIASGTPGQGVTRAPPAAGGPDRGRHRQAAHDECDQQPEQGDAPPGHDQPAPPAREQGSQGSQDQPGGDPERGQSGAARAEQQQEPGREARSG